MIIVTVVLAALIIPLVIGSVFVCVPKWWKKSVEPHLPDWMTREPTPWSAAAIARADLALKILLSPILFSAALVAWLIRGWFVIGLAVIERACPYNGSFRWRQSLSEWFDVGTKPLADLSAEDVTGAE